MHACHAESSHFLVVHGSNLLCHSDVTIRWRLGGFGALQTLDPIHPECLAEQYAEDLVAEKVRASGDTSVCASTCLLQAVLLHSSS